MKKILFLIIISLFIFISCSSNKKVINSKEQSFTEYVLLNKYSEDKIEYWEDLTEECFIGSRLINWLEN